MEKDKRRNESIQHYNDYHKAWSISFKYSSYIMKQINSDDLYNICFTNYYQYMQELKTNKLNMNNKNYVQIWDTMLNTVKKGEKINMAIRMLHQTNIQRKN